ncbi:MAG: hypothetical protein FJ395_00340 [Verrucomicrobia bacterium]|nr:hypothetical protein [Verrucomicrobiota bacterium]
MIARRCEKFYAEIREFFVNRKDRMEGRKLHVFAFLDPADFQKAYDRHRAQSWESWESWALTCRNRFVKGM